MRLGPGAPPPTPTPPNLLSLDALSLSNLIQTRQVKCLDLMDQTLTRIDEINPKLNAIVSIKSKSELLNEAREADEELNNGIRKGWLHGIPLAIKDLSRVKGLPTTLGGSKLYASLQQSGEGEEEVDDPFVHRVRKEGAILIGKTNTPEFGLGSHTFNEMFGYTHNPYDTTKSAGGSSGGAAVSLASRMLCLADGTDMMGSLRNPAGWNGIYSLRPTAGLISDRYDDDDDAADDDNDENENEAGVEKKEDSSLMLPYPISTPGPMGRTPLDIASFLQTMVGNPQNFDASTIQSEPDVTSTKIGWLADWSGAYPMEEGILSLCESTLQNVFETKMNCNVEKVSSVPFDAKKLWYSWTTIRSRHIMDGLSTTFGGLDTILSKAKKGDDDNVITVKPEALWEVQRGLQITNDELRHAVSIAHDWSNIVDTTLFTQYDVCALPTAQVWPFDVYERYPTKINKCKLEEYHRWMEVVIPVTLAGLPCVTVSAGFDEERGEGGLCMGLQLFGPRGSDSKLLSLAQAYHRIVDWPSKHPPPV